MQGYVDLIQTRWWPIKKQLAGTSKVVGGETYTVVIAANGYLPKAASSSDPRCQVRLLAGEQGLLELRIDRPENAVVEWVVTFSADRYSE